jgi:hypothetical protein
MPRRSKIESKVCDGAYKNLHRRPGQASDSERRSGTMRAGRGFANGAYHRGPVERSRGIGPAFAGTTLRCFAAPVGPTAAFCNGEFSTSQSLFDAGAFAGQFFRKQHAYEMGRQSEGKKMKHFAAQQNPQNRPC